MGTIRGGLLIVTSILLFLALFVSLFFLTISLSLTYENINKEMVPLLKDSASDTIKIRGEIVGDYSTMQGYCQTYSDYVVSYRESRIVIPCSVVAEGEEASIDYGIKEFVEWMYFNNYDCGFVSCFDKYEVPFFLVSKQVQEDVYSRFNFSLLLIGVLCVLGFVLSEKKSNFFILLAVLMVLAALPFMSVGWIINLFGEALQGVMFIFFGKSFLVFKSVAIVGGILLVTGLVLKFFNFDFDIHTIFSGKKEKKGKDFGEEKKGKKSLKRKKRK